MLIALLSICDGCREEQTCVFYSFCTFQRRLLCLNFQSTKSENNSNLFLKVNKKLMLWFLFSTQDYFNNRPRLASVQSHILCADFRVQAYSGKNHCNFSWRFSLHYLILDCQRDNLFLSSTGCVSCKGDLPIPSFPPPSSSRVKHTGLHWLSEAMLFPMLLGRVTARLGCSTLLSGGRLFLNLFLCASCTLQFQNLL